MIHPYLSSDYKIHLHCYTGPVDQLRLFFTSFPNMKVGLTNLVTKKKDIGSNIVDLVNIQSDYVFARPNPSVNPFRDSDVLREVRLKVNLI